MRTRMLYAVRRAWGSIATVDFCGRAGGSGRARASCMAFLMALSCGPGNRPAIEESVGDNPDMEQTGEGDETGRGPSFFCGRGTGRVFRLPIRPRRRNQRAAAIGKDEQQQLGAAAPHAPHDGQGLSFKWMMPAQNRRRSRKLAVMGSAWWCPSILSARIGWSVSSNIGSATSASSA